MDRRDFGKVVAGLVLSIRATNMATGEQLPGLALPPYMKDRLVGSVLPQRAVVELFGSDGLLLAAVPLENTKPAAGGVVETAGQGRVLCSGMAHCYRIVDGGGRQYIGGLVGDLPDQLHMSTVLVTTGDTISLDFKIGLAGD